MFILYTALMFFLLGILCYSKYKYLEYKKISTDWNDGTVVFFMFWYPFLSNIYMVHNGRIF